MAFKVSARTILELGSELISSDTIAFYELIKNGFDAKSKRGVEIHFRIVLRRNAYLKLKEQVRDLSADISVVKSRILSALNPKSHVWMGHDLIEELNAAVTHIEVRKLLDLIYRKSSIMVTDTGSGMTMEDLVNNFLVVGTPSRKKSINVAIENNESEVPFLGEKGIGRLSAMRLGNHLRVETSVAGQEHINALDINWDEFSELDAMLDEIAVAPYVDAPKPDPHWSGTRIIITNLTEDWTRQRVEVLASTEFSKLTDPFLNQRQRPRIALHWDDDRIEIPAMNKVLLSHAHAAVKGRYMVKDDFPQLVCTSEVNDLGFEHPRDVRISAHKGDDLNGILIGADQSILPEALRAIGPFEFEMHWFNRRRLTAVEGLGKKSEVADLQKRWSGIMLFRDDFRVFPYGQEDDDWLKLDRAALGRKGYALNKAQFIGKVSISRIGNPLLLDQTNREGLRINPEQQLLIDILEFVISDVLFTHIKDVEDQYKVKKVDLSNAEVEVKSLERRTRTAISQIGKLLPAGERQLVRDLEEAVAAYADLSERARARVAEAEQESRQMVEMAGIGLLIEVVAHELARVSENAIANLENIRRDNVPQEIRSSLDLLRDQMKTLSKRIRILDPLSVSGRQRTETFDVGTLLRDIVEGHALQFERHGIEVELNIPNFPIKIKAVRGMIIQILENLISNSIYWMDVKKMRDNTFTPTVSLGIELDPVQVTYKDNGSGIAPENADQVFKPFYSLKQKRYRRGLGLFIARESAKYNGGNLVLLNDPDPDTGRLHAFVIQFSGDSINI